MSGSNLTEGGGKGPPVLHREEKPSAFRVKSTIDNERYKCGAFIDLQKAFDTVNHSILFEKMRTLWDKWYCIIWSTSYLTDPQQYVSVNGHCSNYLNISYSVAQTKDL